MIKELYHLNIKLGVINLSKHEGCYKGYTLMSESWYYEANRPTMNCMDEVNFGYFDPEGGTSGEMSMEWHDLNNELVPKLGVYNDGWDALSNFQDLIVELGKLDDINISPKQFCDLLDTLGFKDGTERIRY